MHAFDTPFIVPVVAMLIPIVAIIGGIWGKAHSERVKADQRMAMLARGIPLPEIEAVLHKDADAPAGNLQPFGPRDPMSSLAKARRAAIVLASIGLGLVIFFFALAVIEQDRDVLCGAAAGLIPLAIGIGFVVDYRLQKRDLARLGLVVDPDTSPHN